MKPYTLTELCRLIDEALQIELDPTYWVRAEISSLQARGHCYLELVEKADNALLSAKMRATCWQSTWNQLNRYFQQETGRNLTVGMQVLVAVEVQFHAVYGLSLNIVDIDPTFTMGELALKRQETIARLEQEGMMQRQQELALPTLVRRLAVISSDSAAGYQDFVDQLTGSPYRFECTIFHALMQGDRAAESMIDALQAIVANSEEWDAIVVIRGGGATTDLGCFDDYALCRTIATMPIPVLSGIGHTRDVSILDMVSHEALKTPTAVASWLVDRMGRQMQQLTYLRQRLTATAQRQVLVRRHRLELLAERIKLCSPERIYRQGYSLTMADGKIVRSSAEVEKGARLTTWLQDGKIESEVV